MRLPLFVARRYLFARKSHHVINIISLISAVGIAIGTAALIIILSVYNGFDHLVRQIYSNIESDFVITASRSKSFVPEGAPFDRLHTLEGIETVFEIVEDNVFVNYADAQGIATLKGVDTSYCSQPNLKRGLVEGNFDILHGEIAQAVLGRGLARELRVRTAFLDPLEVYFPKRSGNISLTNPMTSLNKAVFFPAGIVALERETDKTVMYVPIGHARELLGYTEEVTSLEVRLKDPDDCLPVQKQLSALLGDGYTVKNRAQQNDTVYKMMTYEKIAIYMILLFIILVVSCNVFGSLTMLIIEKKGDIHTLKHLGASDGLIKRIFTYEGWLISLCGAAAGLLTGIVLCLVQQYTGIIKMPGNFIVSAYPVIISGTDILLTFLGVSLIGFILTALPALKTIPDIIDNRTEENQQ